jgi:hypothetical protein
MAGQAPRALAGVQVTTPKRTPAYRYWITNPGTNDNRLAVTIYDGDRHVVTAYADADRGAQKAHTLGRELVAALTEEIARVRGVK